MKLIKRKYFLLKLFVFILGCQGSLQQCVNLWDAVNPGDPGENICPVMTDTNSFCNFPFLWNGQNYYTCVIGNNPNKLPQCLTTQNKWANCTVPTDATISQVTTRKNGGFWQNGASLMGGTLVWISGRRFAENLFSFLPSSQTSNEVTLISEDGISSYACEIHTDKVTSTQVTCYTPALPAGNYLVRVKVNGNMIPFYQYDKKQNAMISVNDASTPKITSITPTSGPPGTFITINGDFKTLCYTRDQDDCADDSGARIIRVYFGGQSCDLVDPVTNQLYDNVTQNYMLCKLTGSEINVYNASVLVNQNFGRSLSSGNMYYVTADQKIYNFMTYPEISNVSTNTGGVLGGTIMTIYGKYFYSDQNLTAKIDIAGTPCQVLDFKLNNKVDSMLTCSTSPKGSVSAEYYGGRGITVYRHNVLTSSASLSTATPPASAQVSTLNDASYLDTQSVDVTIWMKGYIKPAVSSNYEFSISTNGQAVLMISTDSTSAAKTQVATSSASGRKYLTADNFYYVELIASRKSGALNANINAKMFDTTLIDQVSSNVKNEIQSINISSTIIPESFAINYQNQTTSNPVGEVQLVIISSNVSASFSLSFDDVETQLIDFILSPKLESTIQNALNDLPTLYKNLATVFLNDSTNEQIVFTVVFSPDLGDVPDLEVIGNVYSNVTELVAGNPTGLKFQVVIENSNSQLIATNDTEQNIINAIEKSFGIRCPNSVSIGDPSDVLLTFDYESECTPGFLPANETAFCGKCARNNRIELFSNVNSSLIYNFVCFAYKVKSSFRVNFKVIDPFSNLIDVSKVINPIADQQWHYTCVDAYMAYINSQTTSTDSKAVLKLYGAWIDYVPNSYTDAVSVRKTPPLGYQDLTLSTTRRLYPSLHVFPNTLSVKKTPNTITVSYRPMNCSCNLSAISLRQQFSNSIITVKKLTDASPPVTGTFDLSWNGESVTGIPANATESDVQNFLATMKGIGSVTVRRTQDCAGYNWRVKWNYGGDKPNIQIPSNSLSGNVPSITQSPVQDGAVIFSPIRGDMLRTYNTKPQLVVAINNIVAKCSSNCDFEWQDSLTPTVTSVDTSIVGRLVITGTGFNATPANNIVKIGDTLCSVQSSTSTQITCIPGPGPAGQYNITVNVANKGLAQINTAASYTYSLSASSIQPNANGTGGGVIATISGECFSDSTVVRIGENECKKVDVSYSQITCVIPKSTTNSDSEVDVVLTDGSGSLTMTEKFSYSSTGIPVVTGISSTKLNVLGGEQITINITGTVADQISSVSIGNTKAKIVSKSNDQIIIESPKMNPGIYDLIIPIGSNGNARVENKIEYVFYVSSITPKIGSIRGGTIVTIYGDGFNQNCTKNNINFKSTNCRVINCTSNWIQCQTSNAYTIHEVDNMGSDPIFGVGYKWSRTYLNINIGDYVKWSWNTVDGVVGMNYKIQQVTDPASTSPNGFDSGDSSSSGSFVYQFNSPGTFYYWSGYVDSAERISFRGVVEVAGYADQTLDVQVTQADIQAQKCSFPFTYNSLSYTSCTNVDRAFNWCSPSGQFNGQYLNCDPINAVSLNCASSSIDTSACNGSSIGPYTMKFTACQVPTVTSVSPLNITYDTTITILGSGFSSTNCENEVYIGGKLCEVTSSTASSLSCTLGRNSQLSPYKLHSIEVFVKNIGYALLNDNYRFKIQTIVSSLSSNQGSTVGGSLLTINGDGFTGLVVVTIGSTTYDSYNQTNPLVAKYDQLQLVTVPDDGSFDVTITVNNENVTCESNCSYTYTAAQTPVIDSVTPTSVSAPTQIIITGSNFDSDRTRLSVKIGSQTCEVANSSSTQITCNLAGLDLGAQSIVVNVEDMGNSYSASNVTISGEPTVDSISPVSGSIKGGTVVSIAGNGFSSKTTVKIGNAPCAVATFAIDELTCETGENSDGSNAVSISTNGVQHPQGVSYNYDSSISPTITSISPMVENSVNSVLTITGSRFSDNSSVISVVIGNSSCVVQQSSATEVKCALGINRAGSYPVELKVDQVGYANKNINILYSLNVASLSTSSSGVAGGVLLEVNGNGFSPTTSVKICSKDCTVISVTQTKIVCQVPPSSNLNADQSCTLTVSDNGQQDTASFNYIYSITPSLSSIQPLRGGTGGGVRVTITGTNFQTDKATTEVTIAGSKCDIVYLTTTSIVCLTGTYSQSSIKALVQVRFGNIGLALNSNVYFEFIDLWSSIYTWGGVSTPQEGELVVIQKSQTIYFDTETPVLKGLVILGGALIFDDQQDVHLQAEYIIIADGGLLQIGTESKPFTHKATITMYGSVRSIELPIFGSKVIALRNGTIDMHGKPVGVTWTHLGSTASAGSTTVTLKEPVSWENGSQIVIASTGNKFSQGESEKRTIVGISGDRKTLTLDSPLKFDHLYERRDLGNGIVVTYQAEVGLLTRNILFQGKNDDSWNSLKTASACPDGFDPGEFAVMTCFLGRYGDEIGTDEFGAHIMANGDMSSMHGESVILRMSNVELFHVGQAYRLGRYPIHFHMNHDMPSSYVKECAIHQSFNRAVNIHASNYITVERNFIYDIMGGAYFLEDGVEIGNSFKYNLAIFVKTSSSLLNEDVTPAAYWVTNPNNTLMHNAIAGGTHFGIWYRHLETSDGPSFDPNYCPKKFPMGTFFNNSAHSCGRIGLWVFPGLIPTISGGCNDMRPSVARFVNFESYGCEKGAEWDVSSTIQFINFVIFDHLSVGIETQSIRFSEDYNTSYGTTFYDENIGSAVINSVIVGNSNPNATYSLTPYGMVIAWDRGELIKNVTFVNFPDSGSHAMRLPIISSKCVVGCGGWINKFSQMKFYNVKYRTLHRWDWDAIYYDIDGSLSGVANGVVVARDNITLNHPNCRVDDMFDNGTVCANTQNWIRFAFNHLVPETVVLSNFSNKNSQMASSPKYAKRLTHKTGFMAALEANQEYLLEFDEAVFPTNVSYSAGIYSIYPNDYIIMKHRLIRKPDVVTYGNFDGEESLYPLTANSPNGMWYWDNSTRMLSYIFSNKKAVRPFIDISIDFKAYKCRYAGCKLPTSPALKPPVKSRPPDALYWSNVSTWRFAPEGWGGYDPSGNYHLPVDNDNVIIPEDLYVVVDTVLPKMKILQIDGILELDNGRDHELQAELIFINGGQLIVGWEDNPIQTDVKIILNGVKDFLNYRLPDKYTLIGGKGIGVFGGLDLHGKPRHPSWTQLQTTAAVGTNQITLKEPVDWQIGESILISTTSYAANQTEVFTITAKSADGKTLTLNATLKFDHVAFTENFASGASYRIAAAVGLLSRNVKVIGAEYPNQRADLYGSRIIVSDYSTYSSDGVLLYYKGYIRVTDAEFVHPGQYSRDSDDDSKYGILISNLGQYNYSRPTYVRNSAFHHCYSVGIGIFDSFSVPIENNVFHQTIDKGLHIRNHSNIIRGNLLALHYWPATFITWEAPYDGEYWGAIDLHEADSVVCENNFIAGAERSGIYMKGDVCDGDSSLADMGYNHSIRNNTIYGAMAGVIFLPAFSYENLKCVRVRDSIIYKSTHWGIYYNSPASIVLESNVLVDNRVSVFLFVIYPSILTHDASNKTAKIINSIVVGTSPTFNCLTDLYPDDLNFQSATKITAFGAGINQTGKLGVSWPNFMAGVNGAPYKPWPGIKTAYAITGILQIENVTWAHFARRCSYRDYAIGTNPRNDDGQHPVTVKGIHWEDVDFDSKVWIHRPNKDMINNAACIDMDCDAMKKSLLTDLDGSFLGSPGNVISQSEFGWGDQTRGLGDFRIPKEALAAPNGSMLSPSDIYKRPGIVRDENACVYRDAWQAYECHGLDYRMMMIESMDADMEKRRLSPVAVLSDNGYLDLINGPQDHGCCFGFRCQKRVSAFMTLLVAKRSYDIYLTGSAPIDLRFRILNADPSYRVRLSMDYPVANRIDLYVNGEFVAPTNAYYKNGNMILQDPTNNLATLMPTYDSASGTNLFVKQNQKIYFSIHGGDYIDLVVSPVVYVRFGFPAITLEDFFQPDNLVKNLAAYLDVPESKIRTVQIVRANRRKRLADTLIYVNVYIYDNAPVALNNTDSFTNTTALLKYLEASILNKYMTGALQANLSNSLNVTLASMFVQKVLSNTTEEQVGRLNKIKIITEAADCREQSPCGVQPVLLVLDENNNPLLNMANDVYPWYIEASLDSSNASAASLIFQTQANVSSDGYVRFTNLGVSSVGNNFKINYNFKLPVGLKQETFDPMTLAGKQFSSLPAQLTCIANEADIVVDRNTLFNLSFSIVDNKSLNPVHNISWRNHVWQATIAVFSLYTCGAPGTIQSDLVYSTIDVNTSSIKFNNLELDSTGGYILLASIRSTNNEYNLNCRSNSIIVKNSSMNFEINDDIDPNIVLIFKADYQANLHNIEMFKSMFYNCIYNKYKLVKTRSIMVYNGSIGINSGATGSVDQISSLAAEIKNGSFNFNGFTLESAIIFDQLAKAADVINPGTGGGGIGGGGSSTESDSAKQSASNIGLIVGLTVGLVVLLTIPIVGVVIYKVYKNKSKDNRLIYPSRKESQNPLRKISRMIINKFRKVGSSPKIAQE